MCGIAGFFNARPDRQQIIRAMTDRMTHRGPDAEGFWLDEHSGWTFGHRRLSIVDLSPAGAQPMVSVSGRYVLTYNGEIYNAGELRTKLMKERKVTAFRGTSDTEILLEAIEAYGLEATLNVSKGMFALAVYDRETGILQLARDRAGEKPLYYGHVTDETGKTFFAFASDCALFRCIPGFEGEIDRDALAAFMMYKFVPTPLSIYKGIRKLQPGSILELRLPYTEEQIRPYWVLPDIAKKGEAYPFTGSYEEARERLEYLLTESIRGQMVADVPVGAFLSGGIDSPLVVSLMQKLSERPVKTFTIGYDDPTVNEAQFAKDIAHHLGTDHTELYLTEKEMKDLIPQIPYYFSEPLGDSSQISTCFVSKLARTKVTVSLSGDAGDELFCGYSRYWQGGDLWNKVSKIPYPLRKAAGGVIAATPAMKQPFFFKAASCLLSENPNQIREMIQYRRDMDAAKCVIGGKIKPLEEVRSCLFDPYAAMQLGDMEDYFLDDILYKVDRASMAYSLESRIPMLDRDFLEFAWTLPSAYKYRDGVSKKILRDTLYRYVPREMLERPKQGFWVPIKKWLMEGSTFEYTNELLNTSQLAKDGYLDRKMVTDIWTQFRQDRKNAQLVFNLLMAEQWYRCSRETA